MDSQTQRTRPRASFKVTHLLLHKLGILLHIPDYEELARDKVGFLARVMLRVAQRRPDLWVDPEVLDYTPTRGDPVRFLITEQEEGFLTELSLRRGYRQKSQLLRDLTVRGIEVLKKSGVSTQDLKKIFEEDRTEELFELVCGYLTSAHGGVH